MLENFVGKDVDVIIPDSVTIIGEWAFSDCTSLTSITIKSKSTELGEYSIPTETKIYCRKGSRAEAYAKENGNTYEYLPAISGDTDGDEEVTDKDATYLLFHLFFPEEYEVNQPFDFNDDGKEDVKDVIHLLFYIYFPKYYPLKK